MSLSSGTRPALFAYGSKLENSPRGNSMLVITTPGPEGTLPPVRGVPVRCATIAAAAAAGTGSQGMAGRIRKSLHEPAGARRSPQEPAGGGAG